MPLYEYKCEKCGQHFDVRQKFVDAPLTVHDICGGKVERVLSAPALQFKGSGFYITDYAKGSNSAPGNGSDKKKSEGDSSNQGSSESKNSSDNKTKTPAATSTESKPASTPSSSDTK